jgi:hypothetical protein
LVSIFSRRKGERPFFSKRSPFPLNIKYKKGTSYIDPVKRENENILSFVKTASYKTVLVFGTPLP